MSLIEGPRARLFGGGGDTVVSTHSWEEKAWEYGRWDSE